MHINWEPSIADAILIFITWLCTQLYSAIVKPTWIKTKNDTNKKRALLRLLRYFAICSAIILITAFSSLNKMFVLLVAVLFAIGVLYIVYDYTLYVLNGINKDTEKQQLLQRKAHLLKAMLHSNGNTERATKLLAELAAIDDKLNRL